MSTKAQSAAAYLAVLSSLLVGGCQHLENAYRDIMLHGFSDRNYVELNRNLGGPVCIYGRLSIDSVHQSVHFPLRPIQDGDVIVIGYSRILPGLSYDYVRRNGMVDGESYRICGTLRDATPFRRCDQNHCKWYKLENAELQ